MPNDVIRPARETDLPGIVAIYNATVPGRLATADLEPVSVESRRSWFAEHTPEHHPLWVYDDGGEVAGWLSIGPVYPRAAWDATAEVSVYVALDRQRQGIAGALLEEAIVRGPSLGLRVLLGFIFGHNEVSLNLFHRFGFEDWGRLPEVCELDGVRRDIVIVGRHVEA